MKQLMEIFSNRKRQVSWSILIVSGISAVIALTEYLTQLNIYPYILGSAVVLLLILLIFLVLRLLELPAHNTRLYEQVEALFYLRSVLPDKRYSNLPRMRDYAASPDFLRVLAEKTTEAKPQLIVEASCGLSTIFLSHLLAEHSPATRHYALEDSEYYAGRCRERLDSGALSQVIHAPMKEYSLSGKTWKWYELSQLPEGEIDMLIVDGPPFHIQLLARYPALPLLFDRIKPGGLIILDDAARPDETEIVRRWAETYHFSSEFINTEKGTTILTKK